LIGFDHVLNINKTLAPVPLHLLLKENFQSDIDQDCKVAIKQFTMTINADVLITLEFEKEN
jgi:hypothetical protein